MLIAGVCALPAVYFAVGQPSPLPAAPAQLASPSTKPVTAPAPAPTSLPVLARDDSSDLEAGDTRSPAGVPQAAKLPEHEIVAMLKSDDPVVAAPASKPAVRSIDPETVALLLQQGEQLMEAGDFAAARTLFQRAAEADSAEAATALAATYDPAVLARMGTVGITPDVVKALFWYEKAASLGSSDAKRRLELLAKR
jgi:TPR repeat protein